jgi:phage terminase large subunit
MQVQIPVLDKFRPLIEKKKRIKILVGGRASTKTTFVADYVCACMASGQLWCCGREFQNSIDESVHRTLTDEIGRLGIPGFAINRSDIAHQSGGRNFYRGLARNILSLKGLLSGVDGLWIEEGEGLSDDTLRVMTSSVRATAKDFDDAKKAGIPIEEMKSPEIWITMNRGSRNDPTAKKYLARAESELERCQYYEDGECIIVEANYNDMPRDWFIASGLEDERAADWKNMTRQQYDHKWHGKYLETIENAIIQPEWFDACVDAHIKLGFRPEGQEIVTYDPADTGDAKAICYQHGSVVLDVRDSKSGDVTDATRWACDFANSTKPDIFAWDGDGLGLGLKGEISTALSGKKIQLEAFNGGGGADNPDSIYEPLDDEIKKAKKNKEMFGNKRAQYYILLADKMRRTFRAVDHGDYVSPDNLISFSSKIENISRLKAEICRIPRKPVGSGKIYILSKPEMKKLGIDSPNMADVVMMAQRRPEPKRSEVNIEFTGW